MVNRMRDATICVYLGEEIAQYGFPDGHPWTTTRMDAFWQEATRQSLSSKVVIADPVMAQPEQLHSFHTPQYVELVKRCSDAGEGFLDHGDTPAFPGIYEAAAYVVGSAVAAAEQIMQQRFRRIFIPIAGLHHAQPDVAGGFCVFNDAAVVVKHLRKQHGIKKIAYVDIDAHHGDGVFYPFEADPHLIFADIHEDGRYLYPWCGSEDETGVGPAYGTKVNIPMAPDASDADFFSAWPRIEALLMEHKPEFIILQCGADSLKNDPLTHLAFSTAAHSHAATRLCHMAETLGHGRVLALGGGGYNLSNVAQGWSAVLRALIEAPIIPAQP
ncbi:histone deacetylase superfamily [Magnetococcus marinus MC-1]|uniref:Acetoin utilization protein AcuC n=2 Tax=Magnetococcus TaxID=162171 RepID=A0L9T2_MAGMM|nr:histone deacetylase superfamily [Magnetococcus marinus MC-1]